MSKNFTCHFPKPLLSKEILPKTRYDWWHPHNCKTPVFHLRQNLSKVFTYADLVFITTYWPTFIFSLFTGHAFFIRFRPRCVTSKKFKLKNLKELVSDILRKLSSAYVCVNPFSSKHGMMSCYCFLLPNLSKFYIHNGYLATLSLINSFILTTKQLVTNVFVL